MCHLGKILNHPYDRWLLARRKVTHSMDESQAWCWFLALSRWEFFLAEKTYDQVMPVFRVPRDPPQEILCFEVILDDPDYTTSSFKYFITEDTDYFTWFLQSSTELVMDDCPMSGGRVLGGITHTR